MKLTSKKVLAIIVATSMVTVPLVAKPIKQKIEAYVTSNIQYVLDDQSIMEGTTTVTYNNKNYVSIAEVAKALGKEVKMEGNKVILTTPQTEEKPVVADKVTIASAIIKDVDETSKCVTILPTGKADQRENYIVLHMSENTTITHEVDKKIYTLDDLDEDMVVKVEHSLAMTRSMPPQTNAFSLTILQNQAIVDTEGKQDYELEDAIIKEINHSNKTILFTAEGKAYKATYTNKTKVAFEDGNKTPNINSLKVGQKVDVEVENGLIDEIEVQK